MGNTLTSVDIPPSVKQAKLELGVTWNYILRKGLTKIREENDGVDIDAVMQKMNKYRDALIETQKKVVAVENTTTHLLVREDLKTMERVENEAKKGK